MSKMGQIHNMAMNEEKEDLEDYLQLLGWRLGASEDGAKFFIEAANEIKMKDQKKILFKNLEESDSTKL
tara:strand:- start:465 stop:671 length:207 start_codon:yes stop_codon:yes gene_type:complete